MSWSWNVSISNEIDMAMLKFVLRFFAQVFRDDSLVVDCLEREVTRDASLI